MILRYICVALLIFTAAQMCAQTSNFEKGWLRDSVKKDVQSLYHKTLHLFRADRSLARNYFRRALKIYTQWEVQNDSLLGRSHLLQGILLKDIDIDNSIQHLELALLHYKNCYEPNNPRIHGAYFHLAEKLFIAENPRAKSYLDSAFTIQLKSGKSRYWGQTLDLASRVYGRQGDFNKSDLYMQCSRPYLLRDDKNNFAFYINNQAGTFRDLNYPGKSLELLNSYPIDPRFTFFTYSQKAQAHIRLSQPDSAIKYLSAQLAVHDEESAIEVNWIRANLALGFSARKNYVKALELYSEVDLTVCNAVDSIKHLANFSEILMENNFLDSAISIDLAITPQILANNTLNPFDKIILLSICLKHYRKAGKEWDDLSIMDKASDWATQATDNFLALRAEWTSKVSRQYFASEVKRFFDEAIKICSSLYLAKGDVRYLKDALKYMEATKALVLIEEFALKRAENNQKLKYRTRYEDLVENLAQEKDLENQVALSDSIIYWLQKEDKEHFSDNAEYTVLVPDFTKFIDQSDLFYLNYFQHEDTTLSIIALGDHQLYFDQVEKGWFDLMLRRLNMMRDFSLNGPRSFQHRHDALYNFLIPESIRDLPRDLAIVPDGLVSYFPFEVLRKNGNQLLLEDHHVSYSFSLAMSDQISQYPLTKGEPLVMAPFFDGDFMLASSRESGRDIKFGPLEFNRQEASNIRKILKEGHLFLDDEANTDHFHRHCDRSSIIHIATHAVASEENEQKAQIIFGYDEDPVYLSDIYNSTIRANMVVMSACQTAVGRYAAGEGVMSFARAFSAAGCKSVIASLWAVNDQSTAEIMVSYYEHLRKGGRKDEALRNAKLDYIRNADPISQHPYYWAGFVAIGDMDPLYSHSLFNWIVGILCLLIMSALIFWIRSSHT